MKTLLIAVAVVALVGSVLEVEVEVDEVVELVEEAVKS